LLPGQRNPHRDVFHGGGVFRAEAPQQELLLAAGDKAEEDGRGRNDGGRRQRRTDGQGRAEDTDGGEQESEQKPPGVAALKSESLPQRLDRGRPGPS
jgi:hypothetical protein